MTKYWIVIKDDNLDEFFIACESTCAIMLSEKITGISLYQLCPKEIWDPNMNHSSDFAGSHI